MSIKSFNRTKKKYRAAGMSLAQAERSAANETTGSFGLVILAAGLFLGAGALAGFVVYQSSQSAAVNPALSAIPTPPRAEVPLASAQVADTSTPTPQQTDRLQADAVLENIARATRPLSPATPVAEIAPQTSTTLLSIINQQTVDCREALKTQAAALTIRFDPYGIEPIGDGLERAGDLVDAVDRCDCKCRASDSKTTASWLW